MKKLKSVSIGMLLLAFLFNVNTTAFAQMGHGKGMGHSDKAMCNNIPDLTSDQEAQMEKLKIVHMKKMLNYSNQVNEKNARLQTLRATVDVDMNAINSTIDEMSVIKASQQKDKEQHLQDVRNILTDTQKVYFDKNHRNRGMGCGQKGMGSGHGGHKGMGCNKKGMGTKHGKGCDKK